MCTSFQHFGNFLTHFWMFRLVTRITQRRNTSPLVRAIWTRWTFSRLSAPEPSLRHWMWMAGNFFKQLCSFYNIFKLNRKCYLTTVLYFQVTVHVCLSGGTGARGENALRGTEGLHPRRRRRRLWIYGVALCGGREFTSMRWSSFTGIPLCVYTCVLCGLLWMEGGVFFVNCHKESFFTERFWRVDDGQRWKDTRAASRRAEEVGYWALPQWAHFVEDGHRRDEIRRLMRGVPHLKDTLLPLLLLLL